jgi:hypothetical protein
MARSIRAHGALFVNPARRKSARRGKITGSMLRSALSNPKRKMRRKARRKGFGAIEVLSNPRKKSAGRTRKAKAALPAMFAPRANPRRRKASRRRSRRGFGAIEVLSNGRRRRKSRRNPVIRRRRNASKRSASASGGALLRAPALFKKVPLVGGLLAAAYSLVPAAAVGAIAVEPTLAVAQMIARYYPRLSTAFLYPLAGVSVAALFHEFAPASLVGKQTKRDLAIAMAAGGAAVGYYKMRTRTSEPAAKEMGALVLSGLGSPIANAVMGRHGMGALMLEGAQVDAPSYAMPYGAVHHLGSPAGVHHAGVI